MFVFSDADREYLVTKSISKSITKILSKKSLIRKLAACKTMSTDNLDIIEDYHEVEAGLANETGVLYQIRKHLN
ncbi:MAG: hypothetical protein AB8U25_03195 [Rickettsiales endosymbiont of Dermacentor nuttalli]